MAEPVAIIEEVIETLMGYAGDENFEPFTFTQENADDMAYLADELTIALKHIELP